MLRLYFFPKKAKGKIVDTGFYEKKLKTEDMSKFSDIINSDTVTLVDFSAEWCAPCKALAPILKQVKDSLGDKVRIIKIDVDKNPAIAQKMQITGVPTIVIYKNGVQKFRQSGVIPAGQLIQLLNQHI